MIASSYTAVSMFVRLLLALVLLQLGACGLNLGGPQAAAEKYVRTMVEQPTNETEPTSFHVLLPSRVVIDYARTLHRQSVVQKYKARKLRSTDDSAIQIAVTIVAKRDRYSVQEREHTLILTMQHSKEKGWQVVAVPP